MRNEYMLRKGPQRLSILLPAIICVTFAAAQEIVPVRDITGGTSVFIFRSAAKSVSKRFVSQTRTRRSAAQRADTARRVNRQYSTLAKAAPRRKRTKAVDPNNLPPQINMIPKEQAAKLFAGVGEYYMDRNDYDHAIDFFREALNLQSSNDVARAGLSEALALKGNELLAKNSEAVARKFFEEALSYNDRNAPAYFGLAEIFSEENDEENAVANYEKALQYDRELTEIFVPLGIFYYQQDKLEKAEELLLKAEAVDPNDAQTQQFIGLIKLKQGDNKKAADALRKAKTLDPQNAEAFYFSGEAQTRLGNRAEAIEDFRKAIALKDSYFEAWYGLGTAYFELERYREAIEAFEMAKQLRNDSAEVVANLGDAYRLSDDPRLAENKYNLAESNYNLAVLFLENKPDFATNPEIRGLAADISARMAFAIAKQCEINIKKALPCKWNVAVRALEKATQLSTDAADYANLGWAYYNAARFDLREKRTADARQKLEKARDNLKKAVASNSGYREGALLNLGIVYTDLGDHQGAIDTLKILVAEEPKWVMALNELGIAYLNNKNYSEAINQFKKAIKEDGKFAPAYFNLGHAEFKNGNLGEARKAHAKLKSLGRDDLAKELEVLSGGFIRS